MLVLVPRAGVEPARRLRARDFKSRVSTNFTTEAELVCALKGFQSTLSEH
jgi:hypothetical protein